MKDKINRRALLAGALGAPLAASLPAQAQEDYSGLTDLQLSEEDMLSMFLKLRCSLDERVTMGWVDAVNYAFVEGVTYPFYRLLSTTIRQVQRVDDLLYKSVSLEVAMYVDIETGELGDTLSNPVTGETIEAPLYRAGPSHTEISIRGEETSEFTMDRETVDGSSFFLSGQAVSERYISLPQRRGDDFYIRQDVSTRVYSGDASKPSFFYREWTTNRGSWKQLSDDSMVAVPSDVAYLATTAFRPWMKMGDTPGHTVQNGRGGRALSPDGLPTELLRLVRIHHPDLLDNPEGVLAGTA